MTNKTRILFRADGNSQTGLGHVVRSLALAEMLQPEFDCHFAIQKPSPALQQQILEVCSKLIILPETTPNEPAYLTELAPFLQDYPLVVLDGYHFKTDYQQTIKEQGCGLICIDDIHAFPLKADLVINHGTLNENKYPLLPQSKLLAGPRYRLLRAPFRKPNPDRQLPAENNVFLCFGGSDHQNLTALYLERILQNPEIQTVHVIIGSAYLHKAALDKVITHYPDRKISCHQNIDAETIASIMQQCRLGIVPGSSVSLECCSIGLPLLCGYYADNQLDILEMLTQTGMALNVGDFRDLTPEAFGVYLRLMLEKTAQDLIKNQQQYFNEDPAEALKTAFLNLSAQIVPELSIRRASEADCQTYFDWANDPVVRANAIHTAPIPLHDHIKWFNSKLKSDKSYLYIFHFGNSPVGQVRFDQDEAGFWIDYSVDKEMRGRKLGTSMLEMALQKLPTDLGSNQQVQINAFVQVENVASRKVFERLGFREIETKALHNRNYIFFTKYLKP